MHRDRIKQRRHKYYFSVRHINAHWVTEKYNENDFKILINKRVINKTIWLEEEEDDDEDDISNEN